MSIYDENRHKHSVGWNTWHFQWVTKYRYNVFKKERLKNICVVAIEEAARRAKIEIFDMEVDVDHVHDLFAGQGPGVSAQGQSNEAREADDKLLHAQAHICGKKKETPPLRMKLFFISNVVELMVSI